MMTILSSHVFLAAMSADVTKEIHTFIQGIFLSGQNELQSREQEASEKEEKLFGKSSPIVNRFKINVQTSAVCLDILVWATNDEMGKTFLRFRLLYEQSGLFYSALFQPFLFIV